MLPIVQRDARLITFTPFSFLVCFFVSDHHTDFKSNSINFSVISTIYWQNTTFKKL